MRHFSVQDLEDFDIKAQDITAMLRHLIKESLHNRVWAAPKAVISPPDGRYIMATIAAMQSPPLVATKSLILNENNSARNLPQIDGLVSLLHGETGAPIATIDCQWLTGIRTAGLTALAAECLANKNAKSVGFVGTGLQARSHLRLYADMFPLSHIKISGRGQGNITQLCDLAEQLGLTCEVCIEPQQAMMDVDLVVSSITHTAIETPFLDARNLADGCFVSAVDLGASWMPESLSHLDSLVIDDLNQEAALPNKLADPKLITGDLAGLVAGKISGRDNDRQKNAFIFRGHGLGDLALAALVYQKAGLT